MHVLYDGATFEISLGLGIKPTNASTGVNALYAAEYQAAATGTFKYGEIADDLNAIAWPQDYLAVEYGGAITGVERTKSIGISYSSSSIFMNETAAITLQLRDKDLNPDPTAGITLNITAAEGVMVPSTAVTNASGFNSTPLTYHPAKRAGDMDHFTVTATGGYRTLVSEIANGTFSIEVKNPTTSATQNWLETNDIQPGAISAAKLSGDINITPAPISNLDLSLESNINSIAIDGDYIYVNGYGAGGTTPTIRRAKKSTYWLTADSVTYVNNNLASGNDGMMHDGTDLWVAAGGDLMQINTAPSGMTVTNVFTIDATGGSLQFVVNESSTELWTFLRGGASANANKVLRITKSTGAVAAAINLGVLGAHDRPQAAILDIYLYIGNPPGTSYYARINRTTNVLNSAFFPDYGAGLGCAADGQTVWMAGLQDVEYCAGLLGVPAYNVATMTAAHSDEYNKVGACYRLAYDGVANVWGLCDGDITRVGTAPKKYLAEFIRGIEYDGGAGTMIPVVRLGRFIDLSVTAAAIPVEPHCVAVSGDNFYTGNWQARNFSAGENISKYRFK